MNRKIVWISAAAIFTGFGYYLWTRAPVPQGEKSTHSGPTLEKIQELTTLVTQRILVSDIVDTRITGRTGGIRAVVLVQGDVLVGVDLQQARIVARDEVSKHLTVELPVPAASGPRVDHAHTQIYSIDETGLWRLVPGSAAQTAVADRAFNDAQSAIEKVGNDPGLIVQARERTQRIVERFGRDMGWEIEVRWQ